MSVFNFKEIAAENPPTGFDALPEDRYVLKVEKAEVVKTKKEPIRDMIKITFVVDEGKFKGRKLWNQIVIAPKTQGILLGLLKALQSPLVSGENVEMHQILSDIQGRKVSAFCTVGATNTGAATNELEKFVKVDYEKKVETTSTSSSAADNKLFS